MVTPLAGVWIEICDKPHIIVVKSSHPSRVCGLKFKHDEHKRNGRLSHPSRVCGLKSQIGWYNTICHYVTPLAGVWIEISYIETECYRGIVTPLAGVWIEIPIRLNLLLCVFSSHPSRVCGLKLVKKVGINRYRKSHPSRVCGLKYGLKTVYWKPHALSHPSRVCGLKSACFFAIFSFSCHTPRGCVD